MPNVSLSIGVVSLMCVSLSGAESQTLSRDISIEITDTTNLVFKSGSAALVFQPFVCRPNTRGVSPALRFRTDGDALMVDVTGDPQDFGSVEPGPCSEMPDAFYFGYGYCVRKPGKFRAGLGGHSNAAGFAGFEFANGISLVLASSTAATVFTDPERRAFGFSCSQPTTFTFVPGRAGAFDCAIRYRSHCGVPQSPGFAAKAGRFCVDTWNGTFAQHEGLIRRCAEYGLKDDLLFYVHCWQRHGFDRHLPDVYPPSPTFGTADDLKRACAAAQANGWSFGVHLNTIDCYTNSPWFAREKICHRRNPKTGALEPIKAWLNPPHREQSFRLLPRCSPDSIRRQIASLLAGGFEPDTVFIDVTGSNAELSGACLDSTGSVQSYLENIAFSRQMFDAARASLATTPGRHPFVSSEAPCDFAAGHLDGGDCQWMYLTDEPAPYRWMRMRAAQIVKTPWFPLVYHDRMSLHGAGYSARFEGARGEDCHGIDSDDYLSCEIMLGNSLMADCYNRDAYKAEAGILEDLDETRCLRQILRKYWLAQAVIRDIAAATVVSAEQMEKNPARLKIVWSSGMTVFVNRGRADWTVSTGDAERGTVVLPQYGYVAFNPTARAYSAIRRRGTRVVEESEHREGACVVRYANPRGADTARGRLPVAPASTLVATGGGWTVRTTWKPLIGRECPAGRYKVEYWLLDPMFREYSPASAAILVHTVEATLDRETVVSFPCPAGMKAPRDLHVSLAPVGTPDDPPRAGAARRLRMLGTSAFYRLYRQGRVDPKGNFAPYVCPDDNLWERLFPPDEPVDFGWIATREAVRMVSSPTAAPIKTLLPSDHDVRSSMRERSAAVQPVVRMRQSRK